MRAALSALRAKLRASASVTIDIRTHQGLPVPLTDTVGTVKARQKERDGNNSKKAFLELFALFDGPAKAVSQCLTAAAYDRKQENPAVSEDVGSSSDEIEEDDRRFTSDEDPKLTTPTAVPGLHFIRINGKFQKGYALNTVPWGGPIATEVPLMSLVYSMQMAEAVASSEKLRSRTYDPNFAAGESPLNGVDNETFSKYVSIAKTYGHLLKTSDKYGAHMALYPDISCLRHCCTPNSVFRRAIVKPYRGVVRCAQPLGVLAGEEVTVLYPKVNSLIFMLLPRDRRQHLLQERYHFTCDCARCWKETDELELTLSGAFFNGEAKSNSTLQKKLTNDMRDEFDNLHIFDAKSGGPVDTPAGPKIPKSPHALLHFISKYTVADAPLRLHKNHWRISVVRIAYLKQAAFVLSVQSREKTVPVRPFLEQRSFEVALQQLSTEALFVPRGHPFYISTYATYKKMMALLPTNLVAALQAKSRKYPIDWDALISGYRLWEGGRSSNPHLASSSHPSNSATQPKPSSASEGSSTGNINASKKKKSEDRKAKNAGRDDNLDSSYSSDGEPVIPDEMRRQMEIARREQYGDGEEEGEVDHDDEEHEANVQPFVSQSKNKENIFVAEERAAAEEEAFLAESADE